MELSTNEVPAGQDSSSSNSADNYMVENSESSESKTPKRPKGPLERMATSELALLFDAAGIALQGMNNRKLIEYLQAHVSDPTAPPSTDELKHWYQQYRSEKESAVPTACIVKSCITWTQTDHNYTIFPFPDCKESVKLWKQALNLFHTRKTQGVCELHFDEDFLIRANEDDRVTLMPGAIPKGYQEPFIDQHKFTKHCRMCACLRIPMTTVSELRMKPNLQPILQMCLELDDPKHLSLPQTVCEGCTNMVRFVSNFAQTCRDAQEKLLVRYSRGIEAKCKAKKRRHPSSEVPEETHIEPTESSEPPASAEEVVFVTAEEQQTREVEFKEIPLEEHPVKLDPDTDTSKLEPVKVEPVVNDCISSSINDENKPETSNPEPLRRNIKPRATRPLPINSGRYMKYECRTCWQRLSSQMELNMHTRIHEREQSEGKTTADVVLTGWAIDTIKCLQCRKAFKSADELKAHTAQEHKSEIYCPVCGIRCRSSEGLDQHRKRARRCKIPDAAKIQ